MFYIIIENYHIVVFLELVLYLYGDLAKNPLRTFLGLNRKKNKNIKAWRKKGSSYKKKSVYRKNPEES